MISTRTRITCDPLHVRHQLLVGQHLRHQPDVLGVVGAVHVAGEDPLRCRADPTHPTRRSDGSSTDRSYPNHAWCLSTQARLVCQKEPQTTQERQRSVARIILAPHTPRQARAKGRYWVAVGCGCMHGHPLTHPTRRGRRTVPAKPGMRPSFTSGCTP
jgi:hypothetical protein